MSKSIRVCYVVNSVHDSSIPADLAKGITRYTDIEVDILAWFEARPFESDQLVDVRSLDTPRTTLGINRQTFRTALPQLNQYDIIQAHHNHSGSFAKVMAYSKGIPVISREGNLRTGFSRKGLIVNGLTNVLTDKIVCNSRSVHDSFKRWERLLIRPDKVEIIPNGVDFNRLEASESLDWSIFDACDVDPDSILVGNAAMLTPQKGHDVLLRAIREVNDQGEQTIELVIAGDGPLMSSLENLAIDLGLESKAHFLGRLDRQYVYRMMHEIDIYSMPSRWEGLSAAALEALAIGNPCVFSDIGPFTEPFNDVALFHPVDDADALADLLLKLSRQPERRDALGERAKHLVEEQYSMQTIANQYRNLYHEILDS